MAVVKDSTDGWTWYVEQVKLNIVDTVKLDYKDLMKKYISGQSWQTTVMEMNK